MDVAEWMQGYRFRQQAMDRQPRGIVDGETRDGLSIKVARAGRGWVVTVTRDDEGRTREDRARARFASWYVVTGEHDDIVTTSRARLDWWLAHQDVGITVPKAKRKDGVAALIEAGAKQGRGILRGVTTSDHLMEQAERVLSDALG